MKRTLLDKAKSDYSLLKLLSTKTDEGFMEIRAYHTQQAIEKSLKHMLELKGSRYINNHDIQRLLYVCNSSELNDILADAASAISYLESEYLYAKDFFIEKATLEEYIEIARQVLEYVTLYESKLLRGTNLDTKITKEFH